MESIRLKQFLQEKDISQRLLADLCGIEYEILQSRMAGITEFTLEEIEKIISSLSMTKNDVMFIFFES